MRISILLTIMFLGTRLVFPQTMNTLLYSGGRDSCLLDDVQKITFMDSGPSAAMRIHFAAGGTDSVLIDSIRKIFFDPNGVVPVVLSSFLATCRDNDVVLSWTTQSEQDNLGWNVLRGTSYTGPFTRVNTALVPGSGTTGLPNEYSWEDQAAAGTGYFYQLEQINISGGKEYSWVVKVEGAVTDFDHPAVPPLAATGHFSRLYPNPAASPVTIELLVKQQGRVTVGAYNACGTQLLKVVKNDVLRPGRYTVVWDGCDGAGRSLANGTYIIKINNGSASEIYRAVLINPNGR